MSPVGFGVPGHRGEVGPAVAAEFQRFYAYADSGGKMQSWQYNGAAWESDRAASATYATPSGNLCCSIPVDSSALVGAGALVWLEGGTTVVVWDVGADTYYTATAETAGTMTTPIYDAGFVWWWEYPPGAWSASTATLTLVKATTNLVTIITYTQAVTFTPTTGVSVALWAHLYTSTAAYLAVLGTGTETSDFPIAKITLAGSGSAATQTAEWAGGNWPLIPGAAGVAIGHESFGVDPWNLEGAADDTPGAIFSATLWPAGWVLNSVLSISTTSDAAVASTYGLLSGVETVVVAPSDATAGDPTATFSPVTAHPVLGVSPALMFLKG